jgi:hypothetical protein
MIPHPMTKVRSPIFLLGIRALFRDTISTPFEEAPMKRLLGLFVVLALALPAQAHFIFFVPLKDSAQLVFSDELAPDDNVPISKIAQTELFARNAKGDVAVKKVEAKDHYKVNLDTSDPVEIGGVCVYGVSKKGDPYLLNYYAKTTIGTPVGQTPLNKGWSKLPLEIVSVKGAPNYQVLWQGKPVSDVEIVAIIPGVPESRKITPNKDGGFDLGKLPVVTAGPIGIRARYIEKKAGEYKGEKYTESRHYATWTFHLASVSAKSK